MSKTSKSQAGASVASSGKTREALTAAGVSTIDIHAHYFGPKYLEMIAEDGKSRNDSGPGITDLQLRIASMDEQGMAVHALSLTAPMVYWGDERRSHDLALTWNDEAIAAHGAYPMRLFVLASLPMQFPQAAIDELNRVSKLNAVRGIYLGTNVGGKDLDDPLFELVFSRIEAAGLPVFLHPINPVAPKRLSRYHLSNLIGNPVDSAIAAAHLIFGGVLDRHPELTFCLPHMGGTIPSLIGRWDRGWQVRPETKHLRKAPSTYLSRFFYDTISHSKSALRFWLMQVGAERVMLGSDFCFDMGYDQPVRFVNELDLTSAQRRAILGGNAAKLLRL